MAWPASIYKTQIIPIESCLQLGCITCFHLKLSNIKAVFADKGTAEYVQSSFKYNLVPSNMPYRQRRACFSINGEPFHPVFARSFICRKDVLVGGSILHIS